MTWSPHLLSEIAEQFSDARVDWAPANVSVFRRAVRASEPAQPFTRQTWTDAALVLSRAGKIDHRVEALKLLADGVSIRRTAKLLSIDDKTVRRWVQAGKEAA